MSDFLKSVIKDVGNEYATLVADGTSGDNDSYIDTGSYVFNALLSGSLNGGLPSNKITALAGESATGKTFFLMGSCPRQTIERSRFQTIHNNVPDNLQGSGIRTISISNA